MSVILIIPFYWMFIFEFCYQALKEPIYFLLCDIINIIYAYLCRRLSLIITLALFCFHAKTASLSSMG